MRLEQRRLVSRANPSIKIEDFLKRRLDSSINAAQPISLVSLRSEFFLFLTLLDINDNAPTFDQTYYHLELNENQPRNTFLIRLNAFDIDKGKNGTVRYELMVKEHQVFTMEPHSGVLRTKRVLDRELCELYRVGLRAYDLGSPTRKYSSIVIVDVEVKNVNDHVPYFLHDIFHFDIEENLPIGTIVGRLTIGDRDEQEPIEKVINLSTVEDIDLELWNSTRPTRLSR